jgi:AraC family transcriptional regulator
LQVADIQQVKNWHCNGWQFKVEIFEKGQYSGSITNIYESSDLLASVTHYHQDTVNRSLHYHATAHISFVLSGACIEKKSTIYDRLPGRITYYSACEPHQVMRILKPSCHINLELENSFFERHELEDNALAAALCQNPDAKFLMVQIYRELTSYDINSSLSAEILLLRMVHQTKKLQPSKRLPEWVGIANAFLQDRWNEKITLDDLSKATGRHPVTISRYFSHYFSCTIGDYLRKLKVERAPNLIRSSPVSLTEVAHTCGFADQSHFIRTFKNYTVFLPAAYRKL